MTIYKDLFNFFVVGVLLVFSSTTFAELEVEITPSKIEPGQRAEVDIRLLKTPQLEQKMLTPELTQDGLENHPTFVVLSRTQRETSTYWAWKYEITSYSPGDLTLPPFEVTLSSDTFSTLSQSLTVHTTREKTDKKMHPSMGKKNLPQPLAWWMWALCGLLPLVLYACKRVFFPTPKAAAPLEDAPVAPVGLAPSPESWLRTQLVYLQQEATQCPQSEVILEKYCHTLRLYYQKKYQRPVVAWTAIELMRKGVDFKAQDFVSQTIGRIDSLRFSNQSQEGVDLSDVIEATGKKVGL